MPVVQDLLDQLASTSVLGISLLTIISVIVVAVVAIVLERLLTGYLRRFAKGARLSLRVTYDLVLTSRVIVIVGALVALVRVGGLSPEWFVAFSAIGGAAIGLASTKTIGNFIAGLYLLASRPFEVGDYVRLGTVEGVVHDITINYTKLLTLGNKIVSVSNLQILDRDVINYLYMGERDGALYCYTFEMGFDHSVPTAKMDGVFGEVFGLISGRVPREPRFLLFSSDAFGRTYTIYLYVEHPEEISELRSMITEGVFKRWEEERAKASG